MSKMKEHIANLTYLDGLKEGIEQGRLEERQRIISVAGFTVKLDGNRVIVDYEDWKNLWRTLVDNK